MRIRNEGFMKNELPAMVKTDIYLSILMPKFWEAESSPF